MFYDKKDSVQWWACLKKVLTFPLTASDGTSNILYTYKRTVKIKIVDQYENVYFSAIGWNWSMQITSRVNYKTNFFFIREVEKQVQKRSLLLLLRFVFKKIHSL